MAGTRGGFDDESGRLFFAVTSALFQYRPRFFYLENVKGLLSHDDGRTMEFVTRSLDNLGYDVHHKLINSVEFDVPQRRERVIIAGSSDPKVAAVAMLPESVVRGPFLME